MRIQTDSYRRHGWIIRKEFVLEGPSQGIGNQTISAQWFMSRLIHPGCELLQESNAELIMSPVYCAAKLTIALKAETKTTPSTISLSAQSHIQEKSLKVMMWLPCWSWNKRSDQILMLCKLREANSLRSIRQTEMSCSGSGNILRGNWMVEAKLLTCCTGTSMSNRYAHTFTKERTSMASSARKSTTNLRGAWKGGRRRQLYSKE